MGRISSSKGPTRNYGVVHIYNVATGEAIAKDVPGKLYLNGAVSGDTFYIYGRGNVRQIAPELHFSSIVSDRGAGPLYAVTATGLSGRAPVILVKTDPTDGRILQSKTLESTFRRIAIAPLATVPADALLIDAIGSKP